MNPLSLRVLSLGHLDCQYYRIVDTPDRDRMYQSPVGALLIRHPFLGNVLYDTGNSPLHRTLYGKHVNDVYPVSCFVSIEDALAGEGLTCADIDVLVLSHLHFDHAGGLAYFRGTKAARNIIVSRADLANACVSVFSREEDSAYVGELFMDPSFRFSPVEGRVELAPDLILFEQVSHTPGVLGLIVKTAHSGTIIATSDTVYTKASWETSVPPGSSINKNSRAFLDNLAMLKDMQRGLGATMYFGHDDVQMKEWAARGVIS